MGDKKEYIERGALIEMLNNKAKIDHEMGLYNHGALTETFIRFVERQLAADVVEVRHGEWKLIETEGFCDGGYYSRFCCPLCFREIGVCHDYEKDAYNYAKTMYPYCHCGAKMDETDNNVGDK